jgi:ATP-dependent Clp protease ATP-binding subunit ClpB
LRRFLQHQLETRVGRALVAGDVQDGATVTVGLDGDELSVTWDNTTAEPATSNVGTSAAA